MSNLGYYDIVITGPEAEIEHLLAQIEESDGDDCYLRVEDPEREHSHRMLVCKELRDSAGVVLDLACKWGPNYRVFELLSERFPTLTIDGTIYFIEDFRINVFCHGGKVAFSDVVPPEGFDGYLSELFGSEIAVAIAGKWREEEWHGTAPEAVVEQFHSGAQ